MDPFATIYGEVWFVDTDANLVITDKGVFPLEPDAAGVVSAEAAGHAIAHGRVTGSIVGAVTATAQGHAASSGTVASLGNLTDATAVGHGVTSGLVTASLVGTIDATAVSYGVAHAQVAASIVGVGGTFTGWGIPAHVS